MQTRIFYDYLRTRISEPKSAQFKIDKFSLVFYFINTLVHELNSFESLVILTVTNNRRNLYGWTLIISDCQDSWISGSKSAQFNIDKFCLDLQSVYILLLVLNSIESLVILTVTNNERGFFYWTRITIFSLPTGISG